MILRTLRSSRGNCWKIALSHWSFPHHTSTSHPSRACFSTNTKEPLRILFCGSDSYSISCLKALHNEHISSSSNIESIDVVCRPGKPVGRGYKQIRHPPIRDVAQSLGLPIHEIDTFTGWTHSLFQSAPTSINLIVAVSFGLFVPPRLLELSKYGGINVHPSMLPDFRGAAPLHWTLLAGDTHTGVTVQTLDPKRFDHGVILAQTKSPGIPIPPISSHEDLLDLVKPESAQLLVDVVKNRLFENVREKAVTSPNESMIQDSHLRRAPKVKPEHRRIDWNRWSAQDLLRRQRVLGRLWTTLTPHVATTEDESTTAATSPKPIRIIFGGDFQLLSSREGPDSQTHQSKIPIGVPYAITDSRESTSNQSSLLVNTCDGQTVMVPAMTVEGDKAKPAFVSAKSNGMLSSQPLDRCSTLHIFNRPLE